MGDDVSLDGRTERLLLYHATTRDAWHRIQQSGSMSPSENNYDWLGHGIYFWQAAPVRAWIWKRFEALPKRSRASAADAVVLEYELALNTDECLDLLDIRWHDVLEKLGLMVPGVWRRQGVTDEVIKKRLQRNARLAQPQKHYLDCAAVNTVCTYLEHIESIRITCVRGAFQCLDRLYPYSAFRRGDHVEVAIRDPKLIDVSRLREVEGLVHEEARLEPSLRKST